MMKYLGILLSAVLLFALAWFAYPLVLDQLIAGMNIMFISVTPHDALMHRFWSASSFALLGLLLGVAVVLCKKYHGKDYLKHALMAIAVAIAAALVWFFSVQQELIGSLGKTPYSDDTIKIRYMLNYVSLYQIGLFASICVVILLAVKITRARRRG
jgi:ABC-type uncharacterized transport system permease subunit